MDSHPISLLKERKPYDETIYNVSSMPAARRSNSPLKLWNFSGKMLPPS
jgi:hypothetical protein